MATGNLQPTPASTESASAADESLPPAVQSTGGEADFASASATAIKPRQTITIPISVYILDEGDSGELSSTRTVEQLADVYQQANQIWAAAGIALDVQTGKEHEMAGIPRPRTCARIIGNNNLLVYRDAATELYDIAQDWFRKQNWKPFPFQKETWKAFLQGKNGLLNVNVINQNSFQIAIHA